MTEVAVNRGENATLPHKDVVREKALLGCWDGRAASFPAPAGFVGSHRSGGRAGGGSGADPGGGEEVRGFARFPPGAGRSRS